MTKKEQDYIKNLSKDYNIASQFLIKNKHLKKTRTNNSYLELELADKTGSIKGLMFKSRPKKVYDKIDINSVWNIVGVVEEFPENSGRYNIQIKDLHFVKKYNKDDFIKKAKNYEEHVEYLHNAIESIGNPSLKQVLDSLFNDDEFKTMFLTAPAAKKYHHNYRGGLLVHTNEVIKICRTLIEIYPEIDSDLLIAGAILHDMGKIRTYDYENDNIEINIEGRFIDHIFIGASMLEDVLKQADVPKDLKIKLMHMILSHHGETSLGWGSAVSPKTAESLALHHADNISAKITGFLENRNN